jgi:hypothetical protein
MALKSNGVTQVPDGLGSANQVLKVNSAGTAGEWGTITSGDLTEGSTNLFFTDARADARVALLVDSAPSTLDTLNELAAALGDDANFSTTVTNSIATKLPLAGGTITGDVSFTDGNKAVFGTGSDLQIYHTGGTSVINDVGTGRLFIGGSPGVDIGAPEIDEYYIRAYNDGAVELYYDNAKKLETTATGIDVTGIITTDGMNTSANVNFGDDNKAIFGASNDLEIFHQSSNGNSIIKESGGGSLSIQGNGTYINLWDHASSQHMLIANIGGAVELYHNGSKKLATTSTGIDVTGTASITGDGADVIVNSVDHELVLLGNRGASGVNLDKGYLRMKSESTNTVVLDTAGDSYLNGGDVGIGTASPSAKLHMYTGSVGANTGVTDMLRLELNRSDHSTTPSGPAILFKDQDTNNSTNEARIKMMTVNDTDFGDNDESASNLIFETTNGGSASDKMIITGRGDIGIGTINPTAKLDVEGNIRLQSVNRDYVTSTLTTTSETAVATLSSTTYRSAKFMIQVTRGSEYQVTEALMIHDGTDAFVTVYGTMFTGSTALATFDADISGGSMRLLATSATTASTVYKISLTAIDT